MLETGYKPIGIVARQVGKSRSFIRKLIEDGHVIAVKAGGTDEEPWLRVNPDDVWAAMRRMAVYVPKKDRGLDGKKSRRRRVNRTEARSMHPAAAQM